MSEPVLLKSHVSISALNPSDLIVQPRKSEKLCRVKIWLTSKVTDDRIDIIDLICDIKPLKDWIETNEVALIEEDLPPAIRRFDSIAESLANAYDYLDLNDDRLIDDLAFYRSRHELRVPFSGTDIPAIFLGKFDGIYSISAFEDNCKYSYNIDLRDLILELKMLF